ncbi:hypothetical protein EVAR_78001_1 [Eumeta japonica]|uniref:Uncharacterized protein n=1 Tax=Eumeta variegata TaxID=151549 RepID=A0A4C1T2M1_EUMVA|nr:hypothetical protein EVAR_78001_1 [Eumeta japonica]
MVSLFHPQRFDQKDCAPHSSLGVFINTTLRLSCCARQTNYDVALSAGVRQPVSPNEVPMVRQQVGHGRIGQQLLEIMFSRRLLTSSAHQ